MAPADQYRRLADQLASRANDETSPELRAEWVHLSRSYQRLAEQAERNQRTDTRYDPILEPRRADRDGNAA